MKKYFFALMLLGLAQLSFAQKGTGWDELDAYHTVMAATFHPAEEGNLKPLMERAGELAEKAKTLKASAIPEKYQKEGVKTSIKLLAKESKAMVKYVKTKPSDADLTKSITALHDRFHQVMEECMH
ncbi:hypothetical protein [Haliscomenobacter hydrossis]|uniref:Uncharacterized protein n=1 Tax=Haliscomenobacter hydrossis (strain ATCC 27775 / DSM 1100 / LMG 10767 / O) TaxID=760192 RepID=F4KY82_HALH1|nr:hypothetical protein [Haliscomenobacter hydrossis]AEE48345.1 hypothetical protein Halhy_0434 [Haliscomenobacter hydrossis DSM 1100]